MHAFHVLSDLGEIFIPSAIQRTRLGRCPPLDIFQTAILGNSITFSLTSGAVAWRCSPASGIGLWRVLDYAERKKKELVTAIREAETPPRFQLAR